MTSNHDERLREIWAGQPVPSLVMTPDQLRAHAEHLEASIRRRNLRDHLSFVLVALTFGAGAVVVPGPLARLGCLLLAGWALLSIHWLRRYGAVASGAVDSEALITGQQRQLERQRDIVLSWPWGIGLAIPGLVLYSLGFATGPRPIGWSISAALVAVFMFLYIAVVIYGKSLAGRWQQEIDALRAMKRS